MGRAGGYERVLIDQEHFEGDVVLKPVSGDQLHADVEQIIDVKDVHSLDGSWAEEALHEESVTTKPAFFPVAPGDKSNVASVQGAGTESKPLEQATGNRRQRAKARKAKVSDAGAVKLHGN